MNGNSKGNTGVLLAYLFIIVVVLVISQFRGDLGRIIGLIGSQSQTAAISGSDSGLVGHWTFDEGSGTSAADASGNGNTATLTASPAGSVPSYVSGKVGSGALSSSYGYVSIPNTQALHFGTGDFTFSMWVNLNPSASYEALLYGNGMSLLGYSGGLRVLMGGDFYSATDIADNAWHNIVVVRSGTTETVYIDSDVDTTGTAAGSVDNGTVAFHVGMLETGSLPLIGKFDDVRFYNRALSGSEVYALYDLGGGDQTSPVVSITAPASNATVLGTAVTLSANATDNIAIAGVQFKVDGINIGSEVTSPINGSTYTTTWDTTSPLMSNISHVLTAVARDTSSSGNPQTSSPVTVAVNNDLIPPDVFNASPSGSIASNTNRTTIQVRTNKASTCKYSNSTGIAYESMTNTFGVTGGTTHTSLVSGLQNGVTYTYNVRCASTSVNPTLSDYPVTFTVGADTVGPTIQNPRVLPATTTATIFWSTNEFATSQVDYGTTASYGQTTVLNSKLVSSHSVGLSSLSPSTVYHYRIRSKDAAVNETTTDTDLTFTTSANVVSSEDIYIAQTAQGADTGASCANAHSLAWFMAHVNSNPTNWGTGPGQISPGDTVRLCGTISSVVVIMGGGAPGNPVTIRLESGAKLSAPYWPASDAASGIAAAIYSGQAHDIILNGCAVDAVGCTKGIVEATDNGSDLTYQRSFNAIHLLGCENCEIKNFNIRNLYVRNPASGDSVAVGGIVISGSGNHVKIYNNVMTHCSNCFDYSGTASDGYAMDIQIYNNSVSKMSTALNFTPGVDQWYDNVSIHDNEFYDTTPWVGQFITPDCLINPGDTSCHNHNNGMHIFANQPGAKITNMKVYNNFIHGDWTADPGFNNISATGFIYSENSATSNNNYFFNNVLAVSSATGGAGNGYLGVGGTNPKSFNNTIVGNGDKQCLATSFGGLMYNNICDNIGAGTLVSSFDSPVGQTLAEYVQHNVFRDILDTDYNLYRFGPLDYLMGSPFFGVGSAGFADWKSRTGFDQHSVVSSPSFANVVTENYRLTSSSVARGAGTNLTEYCEQIPEICIDKDGKERPATGLWDIGAYQFDSDPIADVTPPTIPTGLALGPITSSTISLSWTGSTDPGHVGPATGYKIYRGGTYIGQTTSTSYTDTGLSASTAYTYSVSSYDASNNESSQTSGVSDTTLAVSGGPQVSIASGPTISNITSSGVTITWTTSLSSSGQVNYSIDSSYGSSVSDSSGNSTSHSITLNSLVPSTSYRYRVTSVSGSDSVTSSDATFSTIAAYTPPDDTPAPSSGRNTRNTTSRTTTQVVTTPAAPAKILLVPLTTLLYPGLTGVNVTNLQKFLVAEGYLTVSNVNGTYGSATTLAVAAFQKKSGIVTSGTPATTGFGLIGSKTKAAVNARIAVINSSGTLPVSTTFTPTVSIISSFTRSLTIGSTGSDVKALQVFLNSHGFPVAISGNGSRGNETTYFGPATKAALARFQASKKIDPAAGFFGPITIKAVNDMR